MVKCRRQLSGLAGVLLFSALAFGDDKLTVVLKHEGSHNSKVYADPAATCKRCTVGNMEQPAGIVLTGKTPILQRGQYRITLRAKMSALGTINTAPLQFVLTVDGANPIRMDPSAQETPSTSVAFPFNITNFEKAGIYQDLTFEIQIPKRQGVKLSLSWRRMGLKGIDGRTLGVKMQAEGTPTMSVSFSSVFGDDDDLGDLEALELEEEPDLSTCKHLFLAVDALSITPVTHLPIEELTVDKIRYKPGESAAIKIAVANGSGTPKAVTLETVLIHNADTIIPIESKEVTLPADQLEVWTVQSPPLQLDWGYAVRTRVKQGDSVLSERTEYFTVHKNLWAVLIAGKCPQSTASITPAIAKKTALHNKFKYANWLEPLFWAPDEFGDFTPEKETWWGGQGCIAGSISGTKALLDEGHAAGIGFSLYSNIWGGDGPPAYETIRRFPETGHASTFNLYWFDNWDLNTAPPTQHVWPKTIINQNDASWTFHGKELIAAHKMFGWDSVRYDSHSHGEGNAKAVSKVRETVHAELPDFQFGYNTSTPGFKGKQYDSFAVHCQGENLIMEEAIGQPSFKGNTYEAYANRILTMKQETRSRGGHFLAISDGGFPDDWIYTYIFWLAGNTHPCYAWPSIPAGNYFQFATRYAGFLWDLAVQEVETPSEWVTFTEGKENLWMPERYITLRAQAKGPAQLIIHLINAPVNTNLMGKPTCALPPPREGVALRVHAKGYEVKRAWSMTAEPYLAQTALDLKTGTGGTEIVSPKLRFWNMIVFDLEKTEGRP